MTSKYRSKAESTPDQWAAYLALHRDYTANHPDKRGAASKKWRDANRERHNAAARARMKRLYHERKEANNETQR